MGGGRMTGTDTLAQICQPGELIALARARRALELGRLPEWGTVLTPLVWQRLRQREGSLSSGTLVAVLRQAVRQRQMAVARDLFILLMERIETGNRFWARQSVRRIVNIPVESERMMREDLHQELTLYLWEELALRDGEGWELFFRRSLAYARLRAARRYLERHGYRPSQPVVAFFSEVVAQRSYDERDAVSLASALARAEPDNDAFTAADLADLRGYVEQLPPRERAAVVMRYWLGAREHEIAIALGVTVRTVRNLLHRANARLYALYTGTDHE